MVEVKVVIGISSFTKSSVFGEAQHMNTVVYGCSSKTG